jgi:UDP-N-acetylmuramoyl-L-alanyl-D-glutamate--2,6-diaminopimelate ligase
MEVSSHALHQKRTHGLDFIGGAFTNISHDHLDYHNTFKEYIKVKKSFFDGLSNKAFSLTNIDDKNGSVMQQNTVAKKISYGLKNKADFQCRIIENSFTGLILNIDGEEMHTQLIGEFNAYNLLSVYAIASLLGVPKTEALQALSSLSSAEGRFDYLVSPAHKIIGIVDYAHTPDALQKILIAIKSIRTGNEQLITIIGCGGDRDKEKRPIMAKVACDLSDKVILTSDNPRSEEPGQIISDMEKGVMGHLSRKALSVGDRKQAIKSACMMAQPNDIVLIAGKGHEKYQDIKGVKYPFDDKEILKETFAEMGI